MNEMTEHLAASLESHDPDIALKEVSAGSDQTPTLHPDIALLQSISGIGRIVLGILLAEAFPLIEKHDRAA